jgi:hypothetical protein
MGPPPVFVFQTHTLTIIPHTAAKFICIHTWPPGKDKPACTIRIMRAGVVSSTANLRIKHAYLLVVYLMTLSVPQTRQWWTVGLVVIWRAEEVASTKLELGTSLILITSANVHWIENKRLSQQVAYSQIIVINERTSQTTRESVVAACGSTEPKTITVLAICCYVGKIVRIIFNTYCSHRPILWDLRIQIVTSIKPCKAGTEITRTLFITHLWTPLHAGYFRRGLELVYLYRNINTLP